MYLRCVFACFVCSLSLGRGWGDSGDGARVGIGERRDVTRVILELGMDGARVRIG